MRHLIPEEAPVRLERSILFVPAFNWRMIEKAVTLPADAICLDLEDSVAPDQKATARANVIRAFSQLDFKGRLRIFRTNGLETPFAYRDLIEIVEALVDQVDLVMVPKVGSPHDVLFVAKLLTQIEMHCHSKKRIGIEAQIESASGFLSAREIAEASPRLDSLVFGPGDYAASMQMPSSGIGEFDEWDESCRGHRCDTVMHTIVAAARANGLRCLDGPIADYHDSGKFEKSCRIARAMGFDGKQCIHPTQLAAANAVFAPSANEAAFAERVIQAYDHVLSKGLGAASLEGKMIDAATVRVARVVAQKYRLSQSR
jgi:citrate lyase subunit beta/citryl-CoA lyase